MFEAMTYENILNDMLTRVTSDVDKREGSIIFDALAPTAYHLAQTYFYLDAFIDLVSGDTAVGEYLDKVVADYGLTRKTASYAVRRIETDRAVDIGTRWSINNTTYVITAVLSANSYSATCEQIGEIGNAYSGVLDNIDNLSGVTATLTTVIKSGEDVETDDALRERFFAKVRMPATSGNANQYRQWAMSVQGIGDAKIFPLWNGPGSVKVVVVNNDKLPASANLIADVFNYIEQERPIGATVNVVSGTPKEVSISAIVSLASGYNLHSVTEYFTESLKEYFKDITFKQPYISHAKIGTILLSTEGVADYSNLLINNSGANIPLAEEEIPVLGLVGLEM